MSTPSASAPFWGHDPIDIWQMGYDAAKHGRSADSNPFLTGEAEELATLPQGQLDPWPEGSTPGSSFVRVSGEDFRDILEAERLAGVEGLAAKIAEVTARKQSDDA